MSKKLIAIGFALLIFAILAGCSDPNKATRVLLAAGYTEVHITGFRMFACSEDDTIRTGFTARGPSGNQVAGTVCSAWLKGSTIRLD